MKIKICGITNPADALAAVEAGADALGFICYPPSARYIEPPAIKAIVDNLPPFVSGVGVFVDEPAEWVAAILASTGLRYAQLHGAESPAVCAEVGATRAIKGVRLRPGDEGEAVAELPAYRQAVGSFLLDTYHPTLKGGTGLTFDWSAARRVAAIRPVILSGGLTPANVAEAIAAVRPFGVDVASGVEAAPGRKDHDKLRAFVAEARGAEAALLAERATR